MVKLEHVTKNFGDTLILEDAGYSFPTHGLVCLLGPSGSGKTTLLNLIAGFDSDYQGNICSCGRTLSELKADELCAYRRDCVGFVFQNYHLLPGYSVLENVLASGELSGESREESERKAYGLLKRLGIGEKANQKVETLSGGQKQRAAIARALMGEPQIILADEPTGALDRKTSNEIMELLKELSQERLVLVITHDAKVCEFADEVIHIRDKGIAAEPQSEENHGTEPRKAEMCEAEIQCAETADAAEGDSRTQNRAGQNAMLRDETSAAFRKAHTSAPTPRKRAARNFRIHLSRYIAVAAAISIGMLAFLFSLSFGNVMDREIQAFKEKNTVFNNGYIKGADDGAILTLLQEERRIENAYHQYKLNHISLTLDGHEEVLEEKLPLPKTTESLSYGIMPRRGEDEIAISPSLAKKFAQDIKSLLGQTMTLAIDDTYYSLVVCGIYNAGYDDFFVSSDVEQQLYENLPKEDNYSISYDVSEFEDVVAVSNLLELRGIHAQNASAEVYTMQESFRSLDRLFQVIAVIVLFLALFLCAVLLVKLQNSRYREMGLLSALGFRAAYLHGMIRWENLLLSVFSAVVTAVLYTLSAAVCGIIHFPLNVGAVQLILCMGGTFVVIIGISSLTSMKLIRTEPAEALKHN